MKLLSILLCLFIIGCEKRAADPDMEVVKAWIVTEEARTEIVNAFDSFGDLLDRLPPGNPNLRSRPESLDQLAPIKSWILTRVDDDTDYSLPFTDFAILAEEKGSQKTWFYYLGQFEGKFSFDPAGFEVTKSEFEKLGNPVSMRKANAMIQAWRRDTKLDE